MSIYGYSRETTPLLESKRKDLLIYRDVISPDVYTIACLKRILTFATNFEDSAFFTKPSLIELFNSAGFKTYWIDNQGLIGDHESLFGVLAKQATHLTDLTEKSNFAYDEVVFPYLLEILNDKAVKNKAVFIHLMGNHTSYNQRYPKAFDKFGIIRTFNPTDVAQSASLPALHRASRNVVTGSSMGRSLTSAQQKIINEYDNSVLYNDFIVSSIIDMVKKQTDFSYVLYFSDHADELFEHDDFYGHSFSKTSKAMCQIPFILWRSEQYKEFVKIPEETSRPYTTNGLIYGISQLSGLEYEDYDESKSIFSVSFKEAPRKVGDKLYDNLK
ncbi:MAG: phosphoethanolamine transferase [Candidatus Azobacteroides sp.]|nr:phosphoethanolamine transferase [Candidatus Azobacteroides sp.]